MQQCERGHKWVLGASRAVTVYGLAAALLCLACTPRIEKGHFRCDPTEEDPCPPGLACLFFGSEFRCDEPGQNVCGDGIIQPGEQCDGTNIGGKTCEDFIGEAGTLYCLQDTCRVYCTVCGNGVVEMAPDGRGEQCDPENPDSDLDCSDDCKLRYCGNGILDEPEEDCDFADPNEGHACSVHCRYMWCGNEIVDLERGEHCDDGNSLSRDGCSSGCTAEFPSWTEWRCPLTDGRYSARMVYDEARDRHVLFGGTDQIKLLTETWEYDGDSWQLRKTATSPPARVFFDMVYDSANARVLLYGGLGNTGRLEDTWIYDGLDWTELTPLQSPGVTAGHTMAFDSRTGLVVLLGGDHSQNLYGTWAFDGTTWTQMISDTNSPPRRYDAALVYDARRERIVRFGGQSSSGISFDDTWELDTTSWVWQQRNPATRPPGRHLTNLVYDAQQEQIVLLWGLRFDGSVYSAIDDIWTFDGTDWQELTPTGAAPPGRSGAAGAYDTLRDHVVLFGGQSFDAYGETWLFDGEQFSVGNNVYWPPDRTRASMAFDSRRGLTVLFGGAVPYLIRDDTWEFDGVQWARVESAQAPMRRMSAGMAFDHARGKTVLFGGWSDVTGSELDDTWELDEAGWQERHFSTKPPALNGDTLAYDVDREVMVLAVFGAGEMQTWEYDGTAWLRIDTVNTPDPRNLGAMTYDASEQRMILVGGTQDGHTADLYDTWAYDGTDWQIVLDESSPYCLQVAVIAPLLFYDWSRRRVVHYGGQSQIGIPGANGIDAMSELRGGCWQPLSPVLAPSRRELAAGAYDTWRRTLVMFGGVPGTNQTWEYTYTSNYPEEDCSLPFEDNDGDGLLPAIDPDCNLPLGP
ncbi:MAG: kelch repeat-containing protein [bacterium]